MSKEDRNLRLAEKLRRTRSSEVEIIIESGAGSLLPPTKGRDIATTRRGLAAIRKTVAEHRTAAEAKLRNEKDKND